MNRECREVAALIPAYVDESLRPADLERVSQHIAGCDTCAREVDRMRHLVDSLKGLSEGRVPYDLWPAVRSRIQGQRARQRLLERIGARWKVVVVPVGAVAAALVATLGVLLPSNHTAPGPPQATAEYRAYMQAYSQFRSAQALSDPAAIAAATQLHRQKVVPQ